MKLVDITGQSFGHLKVLGRGLHESSGTNGWRCRCVCGNIKVVTAGALNAGKTKSCGCQMTKGRRKDISGNKYGRLTVIEFDSMNANRTSNWKCRCECGKEVVVRRTNLPLKGGYEPTKTYSCGCQKVDAQKERHTIHGDAGGAVRGAAKEYNCWLNIIKRCYKKSAKEYKSYGAIGVTVCPQWKESYEQFLKDVGRAPADKQYIDRINPYGNYEPSNVRWVDFATSNANRRGMGHNLQSRIGGAEHELAKLEVGSAEYDALANYLAVVKKTSL